MVFKDINPVAKIHYLIIPKIEEIKSISSIDSKKYTNILGELLMTANHVSKLLNVKDGFRLVINDGKHGGQSVDHLHIHFIGGQQLGWPPGINNDIKKTLF